jgi:hypothetical protein
MQPSGLLGPPQDSSLPGSQGDCAAAKRFAPNLAACRHRLLSEDSRPSDPCDDDSTFREKNHDFYFSQDKEAEDARKRQREETDLTDVVRKESSCDEPSSQKNADYYFRSSEQLSERFGHFCLGENLEEEPFIDQAIAFAKFQGGECLSSFCCSRSQPLLYKCRLGHTWESSAPLQFGTWCSKCTQKLQAADQYAKGLGGRLVSECADFSFEFECSKGHTWRADAKKYKQQKWCHICRSEERKRHKEELRDEQERMRCEQEREQQRLFEEARRRMRSDSVSSTAALGGEGQIDQSATEMTEEFMKNPGETGCVYAQAFNVYKVVCSTEEFLTAKYFSDDFSREQVTLSFRKLAKALHPDKNRHPQANDAFLKVMRVYTAVMTKW